MNILPQGWAKAKLSQLIEFKYGKALPERQRSGFGHPVYGSNGIVGFHSEALTDGATVIIGRKGSVGEVNYSEKPCTPIDTTYFVDFFPGDQSKYWYYHLVNLRLADLNKSTAIPGISRADAYELEIPLAPLPEQKRIADKLDATLARVDACRERLARVGPILKRFRQSVLAAAVSGRLTADWRAQQAGADNIALSTESPNQTAAIEPASGNPAHTRSPDTAQRNSGNSATSPTNITPDSGANAPASGVLAAQDGIDKGYQYHEIAEPYSHKVIAPDCWRRSSIGTEIEIIGGSQPPKAEFRDTPGPDLIRLIQIRDYKSDKYATYIPKKLAKRFCGKRDVMIGRYGPPIFQILRGLEGAYNVALMKAQPKTSALDIDYLFYFLKVDALLKYVESGSDRTAGQDGVRKELLLPYPLFMPELNEQHEIVRRVEMLFTFADRLEARLQAAQTAAEQLTPALLAKAFRGELVPQDPADEPASELLKRLAASRASADKPKRSRSPRQPA